MKIIEKPWGHEEIWALTDSYVGKILYIKSGKKLSKQYHEIKEETIYVIEGDLINYDSDDNLTIVKKGESFHVKPGQVHRFCAGDSDVKIVEVSTPHLEDVVRIQDEYGRS